MVDVDNAAFSLNPFFIGTVDDVVCSARAAE
jgi:hypothetical protein